MVYAHSVVFECFLSELSQKAPDLLTLFNKSQHEPRLWTKIKKLIRIERIIFIFTAVRTLGNDLMCT